MVGGFIFASDVLGHQRRVPLLGRLINVRQGKHHSLIGDEDGSAHGDENYAALFERGCDSHTEMAIRVFTDPARRKDAKALAHAANYGMGATTFANNAGISIDKAEVQLATLREEFPQLEMFKNQLRPHRHQYWPYHDRLWSTCRRVT